MEGQSITTCFQTHKHVFAYFGCILCSFSGSVEGVLQRGYVGKGHTIACEEGRGGGGFQVGQVGVTPCIPSIWCKIVFFFGEVTSLLHKQCLYPGWYGDSDMSLEASAAHIHVGQGPSGCRTLAQCSLPVTHTITYDSIHYTVRATSKITRHSKTWQSNDYLQHLHA